MASNFNPTRLSLARRRRGLTKKRLAKMVGVSTWTMSAYESGAHEPSELHMKSLASELSFPLEFFGKEDVELPSADQASFRALSRMTAGQRDSALAASALATELSNWIEQRFLLPPLNVPDLREVSPEMAAESLRNEWGPGQRPIGNLIHLMEANGVRIFSLVEECNEVDAFSLWKGDNPFVFLNTRKSAERSRFDAAHELGHLVLHRHGAPSGRVAELEANAFASAFLMPKADVLARSPRNASLRLIVQAKIRWGVSAMAYCHRLHDVGMLTDWHYRQLCIKISQLGHRRKEPNERQRETSQLLKKVFDLLRREGTSKADVAKALAISPKELDCLVFGLVLTSIEGGSLGSSIKKSKSHHLRLV